MDSTSMYLTDLTQLEADRLLAMPKHSLGVESYNFPVLHGGKLEIKLVSDDKKEDFLLDIHRGRMDLQKIMYQNRVRKVLVLARIDLKGSPHQNPDGVTISCPHIHLYREGFADKWAFEIPSDKFSDLDDIYRTLDQFMDYCSVKTKPNVPLSLFS